MGSRLLLIALAGLAMPIAASAEPAKSPEAKPDRTAEQAPAVLIAAAGEAPVEVSKAKPASASEAAKPRRARKATCRCGEQPPSED